MKLILLVKNTILCVKSLLDVVALKTNNLSSRKMAQFALTRAILLLLAAIKLMPYQKEQNPLERIISLFFKLARLKVNIQTCKP